MNRLSPVLLVLLAACGTAEDTNQPVATQGGTGGKGDVFETEIVECETGSPWGLDESAALASASSEPKVFTEADADSLEGVVADQLFEAVVYLEFLQEGERFDLLFSASDDGEVQLIELNIEGRTYDWVKFFAGDTEVGVIFEDDTTNVVVEVSDGELWTCETKPGPLMSDVPLCSFDESWRVESSRELVEQSRSVEEMDIVDGVLSKHKRQIVRAMEHLELVEPNSDVFEAFEAVDEERVMVHELEFADGIRFDWIKAFAGDTEVGVVFEAESTLIVAEVSDGDVMGCTTLVRSDIEGAGRE